MDKQEYLNQISTQAPPPKQSAILSIFKSKIFWAIIGCLTFSIILLSVGNLATSGRVTVEDRVVKLLLHVNSTNAIIDTYQSSVKSSTLRSYSTSLGSILGDTSNKLTTYATAAYQYSPKTVDPQIQNPIAIAQQATLDELFTAKISEGDIDSLYDLKMVYEISVLITQEQEILNTTQNEDLTNIITVSMNSLTNLYDDFNGFQVGM